MIQDNFDGGPSSHWTRWLQGNGQLESGDSTIRLVTQDARADTYSDAQLDDYHIDLTRSGNLSSFKRQWPWRPPLRMQVRARASHSSLVGTAGFGFWNDPFTLSGGVTALPEAAWFFYASPPSEMALVPGVPGWGWKAAVVHAARADAILQSVPTAIAILWARLTGRAQTAALWVQRISGAHEAPLNLDWTDWHTYELEWHRDAALFRVDEKQVLRAPSPPRGPLGFVTWVDNQFAVATPRGQFRFGTLVAPGRQWLELDWINIEEI
jgi:hypothetical protein